LLPRLPAGPPPPALAQAADSIIEAVPKKKKVENTRNKRSLLLIGRFLSLLFFMTRAL